MAQLTALTDGVSSTTRTGKNTTKFEATIPGENLSPDPTITIWDHFMVKEGEVLEGQLTRKDDYQGRAQFWLHKPRSPENGASPGGRDLAPDGSKQAVVYDHRPPKRSEATEISFEDAVALLKRGLAEMAPAVGNAGGAASPDVILECAQAMATSLFIAVTRGRTVAAPLGGYKEEGGSDGIPF